MKVTFKTGSEANYGSTNGEMFFASDTKQLLLNGVKYIPKKLSELTNDSGFLTSITKSMVENVLTGNITSHTHNYIPLTDKGLSNGKVSYYVDFPKYSQLVSLGYNEESTMTDDEHYFKGLCKWAIDNYVNQGIILLMGNAQPNSVGYCCIQLYAYNDKDANTGLPRYCSGIYNGLKKNILIFGCVEYAWYWKGSFSGNAETADKVKHTLAINVNGNITSYDGSKLTSISINPSTIGAAAASHTHDYLPLSGGIMSNTNLVTNLNADMLDGYHASNLVKFYLSPMSSGAPADSAKSWFVDVMPAGTGAIVYNVPGSEKTIIAGKSTGAHGHMLQLNYDDNYLRILRYYDGNWRTTDWEKISAGYADVSGKWSSPRTITLTGSVTGSVSIDGSTNVSLATTTNHTHNEYLPLSGGTLKGALTVPTLTATGGIVLGVESINGSLGIKKYNEGFIGFSYILGGVNGSVPFEGISLGWGGSPETSANSVRINDNTFTYKGNTVWHGGNLKLGYTSSGLLRAVQKDSSNNLYVVAPSLFEQGISNNYPKNLRWITEDEGQLVFDTEETAGTTSTVQVSIPVANGTSKGFMKSISTVTDVTGYTPCPVVSGTPYYKLDAIELDYTDFLESGSGSIESHLPLSISIPNGGSLEYILNYAVDIIPRLLTISAGQFQKYFFWLQQTDDDSPIVAYYHCQFNDLWLVIDSPNREIRISQGGF